MNPSTQACRPINCASPLLIALLVGAGIAASQAAHADDTVVAAAAPAASGEVQEIVVTAQKRSTLASKTPISLAVVTGDDLKVNGAADTRRLAELVPNVQLGNGALGSVEVSIRGIGANNDTEVGDPAVGLSIDGIYLGRPQMAGAALYDVERVEVLRGPQGTLYGRNSTAGAINIITNKPTNLFEGSASVAIASYHGRQADVMLNVPLNSMLSVRGVVSSAKHDGFIDSAHAPANNFTKDKSDQDNVSARLHALLKFGPATSLLLSTDLSQDHGAGAGAALYQSVVDHPTGSAGRYLATSKYEGRNDIRATGLAGEFKQGLPFADLTVLAGHRTQVRDLVYSIATAGVGAYNHASFAQDSVEARLASNGKGALQWVAGVYDFSEKGSPIVLQAFGPATLFIQDPMKTKSSALFGQATFEVTPDLHLTAGARETSDQKGRIGCGYSFTYLKSVGRSDLTDSNNVLTSPPDETAMPACPTANINDVPSQTWRQATYKLGADYAVTPDMMVYASYATGFKAGGFNDGNLTTAVNRSAVIYNPEKLGSVELGLKGRFLQRRLQVSAALYSYEYSDLQVSALTTCLSGTGLCTVTQNAAKATSKGLEVEGRFRITPLDNLNFGLGLTDAKYSQFTTAGGVNWNGQKLDKAPSTVANLGYSRIFEIGADMTLTAYIGERYSAGYQMSNPAANTHFAQSAFHKTDLNLTWAYQRGNREWTLQAFARNLEDRNVAINYQTSGGQNGVYLAEPRVVGLRGTVKF